MIFFWGPRSKPSRMTRMSKPCCASRPSMTYRSPNNRATADFLLSSSLMNEEYERQVINYNKVIKSRIDKMNNE